MDMTGLFFAGFDGLLGLAQVARARSVTYTGCSRSD